MPAEAPSPLRSLPVPLKQKFLFPGGVWVFICCCFSSALCAVLVAGLWSPSPAGGHRSPALPGSRQHPCGRIQHPPWGCAGRPPPRLLQRESSRPSCAFLSCRKREVAQASPYFCHENYTLRLAAEGAWRRRAEGAGGGVRLPRSRVLGGGSVQKEKKAKEQAHTNLKLFPLSLRACVGFAETYCAIRERFAQFWPRDGEGQVHGAAFCEGKKFPGGDPEPCADLASSCQGILLFCSNQRAKPGHLCDACPLHLCFFTVQRANFF